MDSGPDAPLPHDAMDALLVGINSTKVNWVLDADIRSFFDTMSQEWLIGVRGTPRRRPTYHPPGPEMAQGGRAGRWGRDGGVTRGPGRDR